MSSQSITLLKKYLRNNAISVNLEDYLCVVVQSVETKQNNNLIEQIIIDSFDFHSDAIKDISEKFSKDHDVFLGRVQKIQLKKYLDYQNEADLDKFLTVSQLNDSFRKVFIDYIRNIKRDDLYKSEYKKTIDSFLNLLKKSIKSNNKKRTTDYLNFLYSRLLSINENSKLSVSDLFDQNKIFLEKILNKDEWGDFRKFCVSKSRKITSSEAIDIFNTEYLKLINRRKKKEYALVHLQVDQKLYAQFNDYEAFLSALFHFIDFAYTNIENHKTLAIHIKDVFHENVNIKWHLYAYLVVYAEKFKSYTENRAYYDPSIICIDTLRYKLDIDLSQQDINEVKSFFKKGQKNSLNKFSNNLLNKNIELIESFRNIHHGFTFRDLFILRNVHSSKNTPEISFIKNETELLLVFSKHEIYDEKIPCPVCGSLKVSGNSFPEVGVKSWECKNPHCLERSKTNRGKRFSERTVVMQKSNHDFSKENVIQKDLIKRWRKDVVENSEKEDLFLMLVKYFTYKDDKILGVNLASADTKVFNSISKNQKRVFEHKSFSSCVKNPDKNKFSEFETGVFFKKLFELKSQGNFKKTKSPALDRHLIINDDALKILNAIGENKISHMVTSPPYYNAREYSNWPNLFSYINDMHLINLASYFAMKKGGVYFYNIGDIFDNENIIVKSKMGEKRVPLGAYTIISFLKSGFELLDNIIWYKGEPQSNRHKNDGNYTPYYQKPANCYEHMFVFKKPGQELRLNDFLDDRQLVSNVNKFTPVFKIGRGGVNNYGHTAPYPKTLPDLSISTFTKKGDIVFDPFLGSGTTIISAAKMNRIGIGTELNTEYSDLCYEKVSEEGIDCNRI